jgi:hypothetical protein
MAERGTPRVVFTFGSLSGVVTARKRHRCDSHLADRHFIEAGQRYVANALPPGDSDIGNDHWLHSSICMDCCPAQYAGSIAGRGPQS